MSDNVTFEFLSRQFERLFAELAEMRSEQVSVREDMRVLTAIVPRHDATLKGILDQLHDDDAVEPDRYTAASA